VRNPHNDPLPVGLFIPFKTAWLAVKEFIETDGALPKSIEWIANKDLPPGTFPDP
jgi:Immunity protein Imm1